MLFCIYLWYLKGIHPDPNMTYAADFVKLMEDGKYMFGGAFDGDGVRLSLFLFS